ncbi:flavin reductase family protein [Bradyrhizobium sp. LHD-71]|uniref:flavin reductase family protein n=1 Tax=Bradyrhizobium sp. LHD-71 TaxID=3072141 RepID=UPI00280F9142|nr:flavin reductase family protein [Bradyrhizobium sp. LHD-71]MDQ8729292.1 flavin reductase family protein [Bradyrhizobium sp. LHD-71]
MKINIRELGANDQYKVMSSLVVPRPIALVSSRSSAGIDNVAPYSLFNMFGEAPPVVILGLQDHHDRTVKDTTVNIVETGEYAINLVDEGIAQAMNICATEFPEDVNEADMAGLTLAPCDLVKASRVVEAPATLECRRIAVVQIAPQRKIAIGEVVMMHVRDGLIDPGTLRIDISAYKPVGRLFANLYTRTREQFEMKRLSYDEWLKQNGAEGQA